jgi:hypothetical protein
MKRPAIGGIGIVHVSSHKFAIGDGRVMQYG